MSEAEGMRERWYEPELGTPFFSRSARRCRSGSPGASTSATPACGPANFTQPILMRAAQVHGAVLRHGTVVDLVRRPSGAVRGVALRPRKDRCLPVQRYPQQPISWRISRSPSSLL